MYPCLVRAVKAGIALLVVSVIYCYLTVCIGRNLAQDQREDNQQIMQNSCLTASLRASLTHNPPTLLLL